MSEEYINSENFQWWLSFSYISIHIFFAISTLYFFSKNVCFLDGLIKVMLLPIILVCGYVVLFGSRQSVVVGLMAWIFELGSFGAVLIYGAVKALFL